MYAYDKIPFIKQLVLASDQSSNDLSAWGYIAEKF